MTYADKTTVSVDQSRNELERTLARYGATAFGYFADAGKTIVLFEAHERRIKFVLPLPRRDDRAFTHHSKGKRTEAVAIAAWEQACRQKWRALNLAVKAKLESVEAGIAHFEDEFLAYIVLPDNTTMGERGRAAIDHAYETGTMPELMPGSR